MVHVKLQVQTADRRRSDRLQGFTKVNIQTLLHEILGSFANKYLKGVKNAYTLHLTPIDCCNLEKYISGYKIISTIAIYNWDNIVSYIM